MEYLKKWALAAAVSMAFMAILGTAPASATELYKYTTPSANDTLGAGTTITATLSSGSSLRLEETKFAEQLTLQTCSLAQLNAKIENAGGAESHASGKLTNFATGFCAQQWGLLNPGELEFEHIAGTTNARVISRNMETTFFSVVFGISCVFKTGAGTELGVLTGASSSTGHATLHVNALLGYTGPAGVFPCGDGRLTGTFTVTTPTGLVAEAS